MSAELIKAESRNLPTQYGAQNALIGDWIKSDNELQVAKTFSEKKLRDYNAADMQSLVELMARWHLLLGVTSEATSEELTFICQFLYDNFKQLTLGDISLAMNWAISGKTDIGFVSQKTLSSYYVSKAIQAYLEQKKEMVESVVREKERHEKRLQESQKKELTAEDKANNFKDHLLSVYRNYKDNGRLYDFADMVYNWLKIAGKIKNTPELVSKALEYGNEKVIADISAETLNGMIKKSIDPISKENAKKKYAREYVVMSILDSTEITELVMAIRPSHFA
jgi:hypothetical protein